MVDSTYKNISVSGSNDSLFKAMIAFSLIDWFKWYIIQSSASSWSFLKEGTVVTSPPDHGIQEVIFLPLAPTRITGKSDWQWEITQSSKNCWIFILLSGKVKNLSISAGNCCLLLEMLVSVCSDSLLLLNSLLHEQIKKRYPCGYSL